MSEFDNVKKLLTYECHEDFVGLWALVWHLRRTYPGYSDDDVRQETLRLAYELVSQEDIQAGEFQSGAFIIWDMSPDDIIARIDSMWDDLAKEADEGETVWFTAHH